MELLLDAFRNCPTGRGPTNQTLLQLTAKYLDVFGTSRNRRGVPSSTSFFTHATFLGV